MSKKVKAAGRQPAARTRRTVQNTRLASLYHESATKVKHKIDPVDDMLAQAQRRVETYRAAWLAAKAAGDVAGATRCRLDMLHAQAIYYELNQIRRGGGR
ncbi:MAG: hypothetical protein ACOYZ7_01155 [Chloroflexota bacterium]